jgi:hypothetical protein
MNARTNAAPAPAWVGAETAAAELDDFLLGVYRQMKPRAELRLELLQMYRRHPRPDLGMCAQIGAEMEDELELLMAAMSPAEQGRYFDRLIARKGVDWWQRFADGLRLSQRNQERLTRYLRERGTTIGGL